MMVRTVTPAVALIAALAMPGAQAPSRDPNQAIAPPSGTGAISGTIRGLGGEPVRRAAVSISGDMRLDRMTMTDEEGGYAFGGLPSGRFTVTAEKPGHPRMSYGASRPYRAGSGVFLREGQHADRIDVTLAPGVVITGTVYDQRGEPMPGVPIMAWEIRTSLSGEGTLDYPATGGEIVTTDDLGRYRVFGLPPGEYTVGTSWAFHGQGYDARVLTAAEIRAAFETTGPLTATGAAARPPAAGDPARYNYAPTFVPGVVDPLAAATFTLAPGEERTGVDLRMQFEPRSRIEGTIAGPDGAPTQARVTLTRRSQVQALNTSQVWPGAGGRISSGPLSPGLYRLMAEVAGRGGAPPLWAIADVVAAGGETIDVSLMLQPASSVTGKLVFDGSSVEPPSDLSRVIVWLRTAGSMSPSTTTSIDPSGTFTIAGVIPGSYTAVGSVPASAMPGAPAGAAWSVRSVTLDGQDVTDRVFDIPSSGTSGLVMTFTDRLSELSGTVVGPSGEPATDYFVIVIPDDRDYWTPQTRRIVSTRPDGSGRYVSLTTDLVARDLQERAALERLAAQSAPVTLGFGERREFHLRTAGGGAGRAGRTWGDDVVGTGAEAAPRGLRPYVGTGLSRSRER
jgi:hypothetical protein